MQKDSRGQGRLCEQQLIAPAYARAYFSRLEVSMVRYSVVMQTTARLSLHVADSRVQAVWAYEIWLTA